MPNFRYLRKTSGGRISAPSPSVRGLTFLASEEGTKVDKIVTACAVQLVSSRSLANVELPRQMLIVTFLPRH